MSEDTYRKIARAALEQYQLPAFRMNLMSIRENVTYKIRPAGPLRGAAFPEEDYDPAKVLLRIHRPQAHVRARLWNDPEVIESELRWLDEIIRRTPVVVPRPVRTRSGARVATASPTDDPETYSSTLMSWVRGRYTTITPSPRTAFLAGRAAALIHEASAGWLGRFFSGKNRGGKYESGMFTWRNESMAMNSLRLPNDVIRPVYDSVRLVDWNRLALRRAQTLGLPDGISGLMGETLDRARRTLDSLPITADSFGLIHADLVPSNYLVYRGNFRPIDFSSCGFGWYIQDIGSALVELQADARPSFLRGYRSIRPLPKECLETVETFLMLGRVWTILVNWPRECIHTPLERMTESFESYLTRS